jgi:outer membrane protein assembly factor BamB
MNEQTTLNQPVPEQGQPPAAPKRLRLKFPFLCLLTFWLLTFVVARINKPYFVGFLSGLALASLITLLFLGWWWFNRGLRLREKAAGFAIIIIEAWLVVKFAHHSVNLFTLWLVGLPLVASLIIGWLFLVKKLGISWLRLGFVAVVTLGWSYFLLIRMDGADASLKVQTHWRWMPSPEEQFLAQAPSPSAVPRARPNTVTSKRSPGAIDWVAFRGPDRDGVIVGSNIATNWTDHPPELVWKRPVGPAWSSLLVVADHLFTQEQRGEKEVVVCYDIATGDQVWVHEDTARFDESVSGPGPRATPTFADGRLYSLGGSGLLNCLEAATGRLVWQRDIKQPSAAKIPMWAFVSSPLVAGDLVIVYAGGESGKGLLAYRKQSGELAWAGAAGGSSYSSPQLTTLAGVPQCLMLHDGGLTAFDPDTGAKLWETGIAMKGAPRSGQPRLIAGNQLLVATLGGLGSSLIEVTTNNNGWTAVNKWDSKDLKPEFPDFVVYNGYAYGFDIGVFCCLNLADGKRAWKEGRYGRGEVMLLRDQGQLLISSETGELVLLAADPGAHRELARFQALQGKTWNHPVVIGDRVFLRNAQEMACYSVAATKPAKLASQ